MTTLDVEQVDLAALVEAIRRCFDSDLAGTLLGRTLMRDVVAAHLGCSALEAEQLVDTMIAQGLARLERDDEGRDVWRLSTSA
jgi:hypothetical protein